MRILSNGRKIKDKDYFILILRLAEETAFNKEGLPVGYMSADKMPQKEDQLFDLLFDADKLKKLDDECTENNALHTINTIAMGEVTRLIGEKLCEFSDEIEHKVPKFLDTWLLALIEKGYIKFAEE